MKGKSGEFVKGWVETIEKRERISLRKDSNRYLYGEEREKGTVSGSRRPSTKTGYAQELMGLGVEKVYGDHGYRTGMKKRPRRKLTLGNMVMRKNRKRVDGIESKNNSRVGGQRERQRIRIYWDKRNLERRKEQRKYRKKGKRRGRSGGKAKQERKGLVENRERYVVVRECEVSRNRYEVRSRYQCHERGGRRKEWWFNSKYQRKSDGQQSQLEKEKAKRLEPRRNELKQDEGEKLERFYEKKREERKERFVSKYEGRKERGKADPVRREREPVKRLMGRCEKTREKPRQVKNREWVIAQLKPDKGKGKGTDGSREILIACPRTQYFAKRKNLTRRKEREGRKVQKWRKVPEPERRERNPGWSELESWMNERMQKVEDENRKVLRSGGNFIGNEAGYREFGKQVIYFYGSERSERWRKRKEEKDGKRKKRISENQEEMERGTENQIRSKEKNGKRKKKTDNERK